MVSVPVLVTPSGWRCRRLLRPLFSMGGRPAVRVWQNLQGSSAGVGAAARVYAAAVGMRLPPVTNGLHDSGPRSPAAPVIPSLQQP